MLFPSRQKIRKIIPVVLTCLAILLTNFIVQISANKSYQSMRVDSGVFAYCGEQILSGRLLYRDCYDNKPPGVYLLNAAAILLTRPTPGGIWLFQMAWMGVAAAAFYLILRKIFGWLPALAAVGLFLFTALHPAYYENGNLTESYALLPLALLIGTLYGWLTTEKKRWLVCTGLLTAFAFLLKPTYSALGACIGLVILVRDLMHREKGLGTAMRHASVLLVSGLAPLLLVGLLWAVQGGFSYLWFAVFLHNQQYVQQGFSLQTAGLTLLEFLQVPPIASLVWLTAAAAVLLIARRFSGNCRGHPLPVGVTNLMRQRLMRQRLEGTATEIPNEPARLLWKTGPGKPSASEGPARSWLMAAVLISAPIEILLVTLSGRDFGHYYLLPIPALSAGCAFLFWTLAAALRSKSRAALIGAAAVLLLLLPWGVEVIQQERPHSSEVLAYLRSPRISAIQPDDLEQYVLANTRPDESLLMWAAGPEVNFTTGRRSPTRYIFPLHLFNPTPTGTTGFPTFLEELEKDPPALILAQKDNRVGLPNFWVEEDVLTAQCSTCSPAALEGMLAFKAFTDSRYKFTAQIADWYFFKRIK